MNAHEIQVVSQLFNPLFAIVLIVCAVRELRKSALAWIVCVALAVGVAQQISKIVQDARWVSDNFPSTHFAVSLAIAGAFWALNRRSIPATVVYLVVYGLLIVWRSYHTPLEMAGALYALPMGYAAGRFGTRGPRIASNT
jgi:membrane-associated phospholipid phosphatase